MLFPSGTSNVNDQQTQISANNNRKLMLIESTLFDNYGTGTGVEKRKAGARTAGQGGFHV